MRGGLNLFLYIFSVCHIFWGLVLGLVVVIFNGFCFVLGATNWIALYSVSSVFSKSSKQADHESGEDIDMY